MVGFDWDKMLRSYRTLSDLKGGDGGGGGSIMIFLPHSFVLMCIKVLYVRPLIVVEGGSLMVVWRVGGCCLGQHTPQYHIMAPSWVALEIGLWH